MNPGELKPLLTALVLPPAGPLLLAALGLLLAAWRWRGALVLTGLAVISLWLLSCQAVAVHLADGLLRHTPALAPATLAGKKLQAIVVLGGGIRRSAPEYGLAQPSAETADRLRYGIFLARASGLPLAFSGGVGWSNAGQDAPTEASAAVRFASTQGHALRWTESQARDTAENAARLKALLQPEGVRRIALVTHAWHMQRSQAHFERAGFVVVPAPMGFVTAADRPLLDWLPSGHGLTASRQVLREWLALQVETGTASH
jgi:uncharacterized SAM-binding protein YcdF (DUF218 family)